jgi:hypothetical protein
MLMIMNAKWYQREMEKMRVRSTSKARLAREVRKTAGRMRRSPFMARSCLRYEPWHAAAVGAVLVAEPVEEFPFLQEGDGIDAGQPEE